RAAIGAPHVPPSSELLVEHRRALAVAQKDAEASEACEVAAGHHAASSGAEATRNEAPELRARRDGVAARKPSHGAKGPPPAAAGLPLHERLDLLGDLPEPTLERMPHDELTRVHPDGIRELHAPSRGESALHRVVCFPEPSLHGGA